MDYEMLEEHRMETKIMEDALMRKIAEIEEDEKQRYYDPEEDRKIGEKWKAEDFEFAEGLSESKIKELKKIKPHTDEWFKEVNHGNIQPF